MWCVNAADARRVAFDSERRAGHIRLSFAGNMGDVVEGIERIGRWLR